ncbi:MAG: mucoidy inhibitor MuiA family protein [Beijerinckiaceae bacterium]|nr:mucoidy inhibitor MuiA family protein [Beijerinckiaceae bacterium]
MRIVSTSRTAIIGGLLILSGGVDAAEIDAASRIEAVTVYPDGASVTRRIEAEIGPGSSTLIIKDLPSSIDPLSLRVEGSADAPLSIASVDTRVVPGQAGTPNDVTVRLEGLRREQMALQGRIEAAEARKSAIQRYAQSGPEALAEKGKPLDTADWSKAWIAIGDGMEAANERLVNLRADAQRLEAEIQAIGRAQGPGGIRAPGFEARIALDAGAAAKAKLTLSYQVRGARWTPLYDARLVTTGDKPKMEFTRRAAITQRTGEDWQGVALRVSTTRLNRGTSAPAVNTSLVTLRDVNPPDVEILARKDFRAAPLPPAAPVPQAALPEPLREAAGTAKPSVAIGENVTTIEAGSYQANFAVADAVSVATDGTEKLVSLTRQTLEPDVAIKVAPSLDQTAYLEAAFVNGEEAPLLPARVMIHRDGVFIGQGALSFVASGDRATLGFGADDAVKVSRVPVKRRENDGGFFGQNRIDVQDYKTTTRNLHAFPVKLTVVDRLPVSENAAIVVEPLPTNTPPTDKLVDDKRGVLSWTYELKPSETREIRLGRRIRWPADREIIFSREGAPQARG